MTHAIARPQRAMVMSLEARWRCECGTNRLIKLANVRTDLEIATGWRKTGPCPGCGHVEDYRVDSTDQKYLVRVGS